MYRAWATCAEPYVYTRNSKTNGDVIPIVWDDDIIILTTSSKLLESVKESLCQKFKMRDLGELSSVPDVANR